MHCAGLEALHEEQVESIAAHVPVVVSLMHGVGLAHVVHTSSPAEHAAQPVGSPQVPPGRRHWSLAHLVHTLWPSVEEEHVAQSVVGPHVAFGPGSLMQLGTVQAQQPDTSASWPHLAHPLVSSSGVTHVSDPNW